MNSAQNQISWLESRIEKYFLEYSTKEHGRCSTNAFPSFSSLFMFNLYLFFKEKKNQVLSLLGTLLTHLLSSYMSCSSLGILWYSLYTSFRTQNSSIFAFVTFGAKAIENKPYILCSYLVFGTLYNCKSLLNEFYTLFRENKLFNHNYYFLKL